MNKVDINVLMSIFFAALILRVVSTYETTSLVVTVIMLALIILMIVILLRVSMRTPKKEVLVGETSYFKMCSMDEAEKYLIKIANNCLYNAINEDIGSYDLSVRELIKSTEINTLVRYEDSISDIKPFIVDRFGEHFADVCYEMYMKNMMGELSNDSSKSKLFNIFYALKN
jgi:hypothetical protein